MQMIMRPRMNHPIDLLVFLSHHNVDPGKFHAPVERLRKEFNSGDTLFFLTEDGRLGKGRYSAKVHLVWRGRQLYEVWRIHPDRTIVESKKPWFVSGTIRRPRGAKIRTNRYGETPVEGAIREVEQETGMRLRKRDLVPLHGGQGIENPKPSEPPRESSVWTGILAWEMQYHFLCDLSHEEQPWVEGLTVNEIDGTTVRSEWDIQTTFPDGRSANDRG